MPIMGDRLRSFLLRLEYMCKQLLAFLFSHVGLCGLVVGYAILGAVIFQAIELPYEREFQEKIRNSTKKLVQDLLEFTEQQLVLEEDKWKGEADKLLKKYEENMVYAVNFGGYDGDDENIKYQWTFLGALLYSITVFTTIGYGHICPKTGIGRGVTILYAMIGIPLMLLCLANIAETLAQLFTFIYFKICCAYCRWKKAQRRIKRAALSFRFAGTSSVRRGFSGRMRGPPQSGGLRRHASLRSYGSGTARKTFSDTRSTKSFRGGNRDFRTDRVDQQKHWDTCSLPGARSRGRDGDGRSGPPSIRRGQSSRRLVDGGTGSGGFFADASGRFRDFLNLARRTPRSAIDFIRGDSAKSDSGKLDDDNNKAISLTVVGYNKKHGRCQIRCSSCCRSGNDGPPSPIAEESGAVFYTGDGGVRYVNSAASMAAMGGKEVIEMKTVTGALVKNQRTRRASEGGGQGEASSVSSITKQGSVSGNEERREEEREGRGGEPRVPQIIISDNGKDEAAAAARMASDEEEDDDEYGEGDDAVYLDDETTKPVAGAVPASASTSAPMASSTSQRSAILPMEERSTMSKRSDEASLRSAARRTGNNYKPEKMPVIVGILTVVLFILGGAVLFAVWEDWDLFEGAYFSFITLTTIGFGDMVPGRALDGESQEKLIICCLYLLFGMALIAMCFKLMQDDVVQKTRWLGQKIGILVKTESSDEESEYEEEIGMEEEEEDEISEDRTEDKRTVSSGSSKREDEQEGKQGGASDRKSLKR